MYNEKLLAQILDAENLNRAYKQVKKNKGAAGVDGMTIDELGAYLALNKDEIRRKIMKREYKPSPVKRVEIPKPNGGVRQLGIPTVVDRFVQQAISQVLTPIFDKDFHPNSYGFRPRKYAEMAILKGLEFMNDGYEWIVDIDLERFFDTVNHDRLMNLFSKTVKDGDVVSLVRKFLVSGVRVDDSYKDTIVGTPQGGNLSPLLSNVMLNELDRELESRNLRFVRYADDCIILVKSEMAARRVMRSITKFIEEKLGLIVNTEKSKVVKPNDPSMKFLGFGFFYDKRDESFKAKPHKVSLDNFKYKLKSLTVRKWGTSVKNRILKINQLIRGWINYFKIGYMFSYLREIDAHIRFRLRMCIWKQWKTAKKRRRSLIQLGASRANAYQWSYSSKSIARVASSWIMHTTVTNKRLAQKGLIFGLEHYKQVRVI